MVWNPETWKKKRALQQPIYADAAAYAGVLSELRALPPLIFPGEIERLKRDIADAGRGRRFILQGGDCVERFADCNEETIANKLKILLQMSVIITHALRKPVVRIGRIAGQYAKPRSGEWENERERIPVYRGDLINGFGLDERTPDPARLKQGYFYAAASLNYIRAMIDGGFADLHHPYNWNLHAMEQAAKWDEYRDVVERILDAIHFMESFGGLNAEKLHKVDFYVSHEALHLGYEESMARLALDSREYYNQGAHMVWIGERTGFRDSAHIEYCRGLANPVGIKVGPDAGRKETAEIVKILNPREEPGKLCIVTRLGAGRAPAVLPGLIEAVRESGVPVTWMCDPMHGNTTLTKENIKTRNFKDILSEIQETFAIHRECGTIPAGLHFELTGYNVTECTGGAVGLSDEDLGMNYRSFCDPRLNYAQSMEMAFLVSSLMGE